MCGTRFRYGQRAPAGPLVRRPEDLDDGGLRREEFHPVSGARVVLADYDLLQSDFPQLRAAAVVEDHPEIAALEGAARERAIREVLDGWLIRHAALVSCRQAEQSVVNTPISIGGATVSACRPTRYGRALVVPVAARSNGSPPAAGAGADAGLLDVKGTGVGPNATPSFVNVHTNGLHFLGCAFMDLVSQWVVDEIFRAAAPRLFTVPTYAVLDAGFDIRWRTDPRLTTPAGIQVRRAHPRPPESYELPALGSPLQREYFEIEMLVRHYGVTSTTPGTTLELCEVDGRLEVRYGGDLETHLDDEQLGRLSRLARMSGQPQRFEGINIQIARRPAHDPHALQLVDFGHFKYHRRFEHPVLSLVSDELMQWGGATWPDDPAFVQPDPELCVPAPFLERRASWEEIEAGDCLPFPNGSELEVTSFALASRFRRGEIDGEQVRARLASFVEQAARRW